MMPHHNTSSSHTHGASAATEGHTIHWAKLYDHSVNLLALGTEKKLREATVKLAQITPGEQVLDVGCGTGSLTILAAKKAGSDGGVTGIDPSAEMIAVAREKAEQSGVKVEFTVGAAEALNYPDGHFDIVISSLMVHHLPGEQLKSAVFAEMYRVLAPNGRLLIVDFEPPTNRLSRWLLRPFLKGMLDYDIGTILPLLEKAGFRSLSSGSTDHRLASFVHGRKDQVY